MKAKINNTLVKKLVPEEKEYFAAKQNLRFFQVRHVLLIVK